jgi:ligand-binding sensor domain-containing protein
MKKQRIVFVTLGLLALCNTLWAVGQSAVPTLVFPPGARAPGMGETFVAIANDGTATFYNPAGMGLSPLANDWQAFEETKMTGEPVALVAKQDLAFATKPVVWVATERQLLRFNGNSWFDYEIYLLEQNDNIKKVVKKFIGEDEERLDVAVDSIRDFNRISKDASEENIIELRLPYATGVNGKITCLALDQSDRLWVGTTTGLRKYDGSSWTAITSLEGLAGNHINDIFISPSAVWVATTKGLSCYKNSEWKNYTKETNDLPSNKVTAVTASNRVTWIGTDSGLVKIDGDERTFYSGTDGMLSDSIVGLTVDRENVLWVAHPDGISSFTGKKWKKFRFKNNRVYCIKTDEKNLVWVGTQKGALRYFRGKPNIDRQGQLDYEFPEWKHFHSKNGLAGDQIVSISIQEQDIWVLTKKAINRFDKADRQIAFSHEQLLPVFKFADLYHDFLGLTWPTEEWGTLGMFWNFISFGEIEQTDAFGRKIRNFYSWELVGGLSYGMQVRKDLALGINSKFAYSALAPGIQQENQSGEGVGKTFAVDFGLLKRSFLIGPLDFGLNLQNMGPPIFYIDKAQSDPIPLNAKMGFVLNFFKTPVHRALISIDANRELVKPNEDGLPDPWYKAIFTSLIDETWRRELEQVILNAGMEYNYANFISGRIGTLYDPDGSRRELTFGVGIQYGNILIDWSYITEPWEDASPARIGQNRFALQFLF